MARRRWIVAAGIAMGAIAAPAAPAAEVQTLAAYRATVTAPQVEVLRRAGVDMTETALVRGKARIELILTADQAAALARQGVDAEPLLGAARVARAAAAPTVYRPYSGPGGIAEEMRALARAYPGITRLHRIGSSVNGQPILALEVTRGARSGAGAGRPAVLYSATQHAREWIATETGRRLMRWFVERYATDRDARRLVDTRDLWFVPVANPDGYDFTFTEGNRLWRKNLRDNNGDGVIEAGADGVDPNRNFATRWNYDDEGSSGDPASETYRGSGPNSEPETKAMDGLLRRLRPRFQVNYHSAAELILYPFGFQVDWQTDDAPVFTALAGSDGPDPEDTADDHSAVEGYDPDVGAELYTTNGETTDHAYEQYGTLAYTPELDTAQSAGEPDTVSVFEFPDDEAKIQAVFEKNLPFALNVAASAGTPARPRNAAHAASTGYVVPATPDFVVSTFATSWGDPQPVEALVRRSLGKVTLRYRVNGGRWKTAPARTWTGGERYDRRRGVYYRKVRGIVRGTRPGDTVEVAFRARGRTSDAFTYTAAYEGTARVLLVAAEDYTGNSPGAPYEGPLYLDAHAAALDANGIAHATYDVDAQGRVAPDALGVLGHFDAVLWETGEDVVPREPDQPAGTASLLAHQETQGLRQFINEGGRVLVAGRNAGFAHYNAFPYPPGPSAPTPLSDDFFQYWLGGLTYQSGLLAGGVYDDRAVQASGTPFAFDDFLPDATFGSVSQFTVTSSVLDPAVYPQFASVASARYAIDGPPRNTPPVGAGQAFAAHADGIYTRLTRTIDVPAAGTTTLDFQTTFNVETDFDFAFVEVHPVGSDAWTTLPDLNGRTVQSLESCAIAWNTLHPTLDRYQSLDPATGACTPTGTTGEWHGFTGDSFGWVPASFDLSAYAGQSVEISISYASDFAVGGTGVQVDDVRLVTDGVATELSGFEGDLGGFAVSSGDADPLTDAAWAPAGVLDLPVEAAIVTTRDSVLVGFGLEQVPEATRTAIVGQAMRYLLRAGDAAP